MIIEAGKRYNQRGGGVSGVLRANGEIEILGQKAVTFQDDNWAYNEDGTLYGMGYGNPQDLISEYKEPAAEPQDEYGTWSEGMPTEPQDEWGPWIGWNGGECPVENGVVIQAVGLHDNGNLETAVQEVVGAKMSNSSWTWTTSDFVNLIAYRIKKEPEVLTDVVWIRKSGSVNVFQQPDTRKAIITLTDGKLDIDWADT